MFFVHIYLDSMQRFCIRSIWECRLVVSLENLLVDCILFHSFLHAINPSAYLIIYVFFFLIIFIFICIFLLYFPFDFPFFHWLVFFTYALKMIFVFDIGCVCNFNNVIKYLVNRMCVCARCPYINYLQTGTLSKCDWPLYTSIVGVAVAADVVVFVISKCIMYNNVLASSYSNGNKIKSCNAFHGHVRLYCQKTSSREWAIIEIIIAALVTVTIR